MRVLLTADLHYNHSRGRDLADQVIERINSDGGDVLVVVGDSAVADGDSLEQCLSRFHFSGPKLFVAGNHELWTIAGNSDFVFNEDLPRRVRALGWQWLETEPFVAGEIAIVGSVGWYDYSFAAAALGIPRRFYAEKISPGAAKRFERFDSLFEAADDISPLARETVARWNDGKFVKLGRSDEAFLAEILERLESQLKSVAACSTVLAAVHHVPFAELLPPPLAMRWAFVRAFLGSEKIGELLLRFPNVRHVYCGHSHFPREANIGQIHAVNIGAGYRWKTFETVDL